MRKILCCGALLALAACDCGGLKTNLSEGELTFESDIQFGILAIGETLTRPATLKNIGGGRTLVDAIEVSAPFAACVEHDDGTCTSEAELAVGEEATVLVTYTPTTPNATDTENHGASVVVVNDSPTKPRVSIHVLGHAVPARLAFSPTELDFGSLDDGATRKASVTIKNEGNLPVELFGLANAAGAQAADLTAGRNPCGLSEPEFEPDFTFAPAKFGEKLPEDATPQQPNPPIQQSMEISFSPTFHCPPQGSSPGDLADRGAISVKAGSGPRSSSFFIDLKGYSKVGLVKADNVYWDVTVPQPKDYKVFNIGQGPLHVDGVEIVEGLGPEDCNTGCEQRATCATSALPECALFSWDTEPEPVDIPVAPPDGTTERVVGTVRYSPGAFCSGGSAPDGGTCFTVQTVRVCMRVRSNDPFRPIVCGELMGRTF
ncbi:MAG: choice-of-anchor D domain-containing protein [Deltaproteobacteria bacterium]|nr:choice-of-anchor D domain-containing protein [Deltaproteobacteria bacterium]